jgi:hypothetical protein
MMDENKPSISEGRVSKLKKRRHPINAFGSARKKLGTIHDARQANVGKNTTCGVDSGRMLSGGFDDELSPKTARKSNEGAKPNDRDSSSSSASHNLRLEQKSAVEASSKFGFVSNVSQSDLLSAIPSIIGVDMKRFATEAQFQELVNQSFEYRFSRRKSDDESNNMHPLNAINHPILGRVDFSKPDEKNGCDNGENLAIAFPLSISKKDIEQSQSSDSLDFDGFTTSKRVSGDGMRVPWSFCQFPNPIAVPTPPSEKLNQSTTQQDLEISDIGGLQRDQKGRHESTKYEGKIRIEAEIGASIREAYDIDESHHVLGRLEYGDERYYVAKRVLPPPPVSVDDSDDDECVDVVRYQILLEPGDVTVDFDLVERDAKGRLTGWISDRSRLLNDKYSILRELEHHATRYSALNVL